MRGRTILILVAVLVALAAIATVVENGRNRKTRPSGAQLIPGMNIDMVDRIQFHTEGKDVLLEKKNDRWVASSEGGFPAERKPVSDILEALRKGTADEVISTNPANQSLFMVDTGGIELRVGQQGKEIAHLIIGKPGPDFLSTYVRSAESDRVILTPGYLPSLFQRGDTWRERSMIDLKMDDIQRFEYTSPSRGHLVLAKNDAGVWRMEVPDTGRVEMSRFSYALRTMSTLKADGFEDSLDPLTAGVEADTSRVVITTADGVAHVLQIGGPAPENRCYVRIQGGTQIYTMARGRVNTMMIPIPLLLGNAQPVVSRP